MYIVFLMVCLWHPAWAADSLSAHLAENGHPNTKICQLQESKQGLGKLVVVQYMTHQDPDANQQEAIAILRLIAPVLSDANLRFVGFEARRLWEKCRERDPEIVFWRDHDNNWRLMRNKPARYLAGLHAQLDEAERQTSSEAYLLFSLALVEQRLRKIEKSVEHFTRAYEILEASDTDPNGIKAFTLVPLIHHCFNSDMEALGQKYLNSYALIAEQLFNEDGEQMPLIKVPPTYPVSAFRDGKTGEVLLEFTVDAQGRVQNPVIIEEKPPGEGFGSAAISAAKSFRYIPKVEDGELIATKGVRNLITFEIQRTTSPRGFSL